MRLTIRIVLQTMRAVEYSIDEIINSSRDKRYYLELIDCRRAFQRARQNLHSLLDDMVDKGED